MQTSAFWSRITSLYRSQASPVVLCMHDLHQNDKSIWVPALICVFFSIHNSDFRTSLTSLYGSQTSSVVLSTHNSVLSTRIKRLCGFQPSRVVLCMQISDFSTWITCLYGSQPSSVVFACKTATLGPHLQVCMCPRPHLCFWTHITTCLAQG